MGRVWPDLRVSSRRDISSGGAVAGALSPGLRRGLGIRHTAVPGALVLAATYYGAAQLGYALEFAGPVGSVVWLPAGVGIAFVYFGGPGLWPGLVLWRPARERVLRDAARLRDRPDLRQRARDARRCVAASPPRAQRVASRQCRRHLPDARRAGRRHGDQRHRRAALAARRRGADRRRTAPCHEDMVARRLLGRPDRRDARARVVAAAAARRQGAQARGSAPDRNRRSP